MKRTALAAALLCAAVSYGCPAFADGIQMLPPTPLGSTAVCPSGTQQILSYSGSQASGGQAGINCVPVTADAQGNVTTGGYMQMGDTSVTCNRGRAGTLRFNRTTNAFEGCNGSGTWQTFGGSGNGKLYWDGNWTGDHYWCDGGYHVVGFHYDCHCSNNATWFECQPN